jgi:hypothetical protein
VPVKTIDQYDREFMAEALHGSGDWGAYVEILTASDNPMRMDSVFPKQRVSADVVFATEADALAEAEKAGLKIVEQLR